MSGTAPSAASVPVVPPNPVCALVPLLLPHPPAAIVTVATAARGIIVNKRMLVLLRNLPTVTDSPRCSRRAQAASPFFPSSSVTE